LLLLLGCEGAPSPAQRGRAGEGAPVPQRIVALAPNLTETLFALGLGDRVVGVGAFSTWPPEAAKKPRLGGLFDANLERIVSLKPDLAVLLPSEKDLADHLRPLGVDSIIVPNETLADVERSFTVVAQRCGVPEAGERLAAEWRAGLAPRPLAGKPRVLVSAGRAEGRLADLLVAGPDTFYQELLDRLGTVNVFADAPVRYPKVSLEEVVARKPDVIIELRYEAISPDVKRQLAADWNQLGDVPAVRGKRVHVISGDYTVIPGPRLPRLYAEMRAALEPLTPLTPLSHRTPARPGEGGTYLRVGWGRPSPGGRECDGRGDGGEGP
jgi:iron complex transport system substrate-binding protein